MRMPPLFVRAAALAALAALPASSSGGDAAAVLSSAIARGDAAAVAAALAASSSSPAALHLNELDAAQRTPLLQSLRAAHARVEATSLSLRRGGGGAAAPPPSLRGALQAQADIVRALLNGGAEPLPVSVDALAAAALGGCTDAKTLSADPVQGINNQGAGAVAVAHAPVARSGIALTLPPWSITLLS